MPNYTNGKIYQIISPNHEQVYIGSTTLKLSQRMTDHRKKTNKCCSHIIIKAGDAYIELIEDFPCQTKEQLNKREGEIMRERNCVNMRIAGRKNKEYREDERETILKQKKIYRNENQDIILQKAKLYYKENKDKVNLYKKQWRELNKETIAKKKKEWYEKNKLT